MTQDIIEMAKEAGGVAVKPTPTAQEVIFTQCLDIRLFAKLVAAKEREACAKIVQSHLDANDDLRAKDFLVSVLDYIKFRGET
jgi:hypothetical protein